MKKQNIEARFGIAPRSESDTARVHHAYAVARLHNDRKIVVLDDDPTGIQTVQDVYVFTDWSEQTIRSAFLSPEQMFFILTNSRGMSEAETADLHVTLGRRIASVATALGTDYILISRGDSTLRGHYPLETDALRQAIEAVSDTMFDGEIIIPFFPEGGRFTIDNTHYVLLGDDYVPVGKTEFAHDKTFGFAASDLTEWIEEKTGGAYAAADVISIGLAALRAPDADPAFRKLMRVARFAKVIVNAADYADGEAFVAALVRALNAGKHFLFRTAAAFPKLIGGVASRALLTASDLVAENEPHGGLIIVGSHVAKTSEQLAELLTLSCLVPIEFNQHLVVDAEAAAAEVLRAADAADRAIAAGRTAVIFTRRERLDVSGTKEEELQLAVKIASLVTGIVTALNVRPAWVIAKGGITSSDIGVTGLEVKKARVQGQLLPGVPVWQLGPESRYPGMSYVIFPGNVGDPEALKRAVHLLTAGR